MRENMVVNKVQYELKVFKIYFLLTSSQKKYATDVFFMNPYFPKVSKYWNPSRHKPVRRVDNQLLNRRKVCYDYSPEMDIGGLNKKIQYKSGGRGSQVK